MNIAMTTAKSAVLPITVIKLVSVMLLTLACGAYAKAPASSSANVPTGAVKMRKKIDAVKPGAAPSGATAQCKDGTYSTSAHHSGTCSGHKGVATWIK